MLHSKLFLEKHASSVPDVLLTQIYFSNKTLGRAIDGADDTLGGVFRKARVWQQANHFQLNQRQRSVINRLMEGFGGKLTSGKYAKLAKCSPDTALRDIQDMLHFGILRQNSAGGRSTSYVLVDYPSQGGGDV